VLAAVSAAQTGTSAGSSPRELPAVRDGALCAVGIPFFGIAIPQVTGVLVPLTWRDGWCWAGTAWFVLLSGSLWYGNRWLLLRSRRTSDWLDTPLRRLTLLLVCTVGFTVPTTVSWLLAWFALGPLGPAPWSEIAETTAVIVVAVWFVTHVYEALLLIGERLQDRLDLERAGRARVQAEMDAMKNQLAPHFLFNCLNALGVLIRENPPAALSYNQHMASIYRYLLVQQRRDLVPLADELEFFADYAALVRLRHLEGVTVELEGLGREEVRGLLIPPASLQLTLENALKHNLFDRGRPLAVRLRLAGGAIEVANSVNPVPPAGGSTGTGLANLRERFRIVVGRPVEVARTTDEFRVRLPLVRERGN
jgi:hypothetical protein